MSEHGMQVGCANIASQCKIQSAAHAVAINGCADRSRELVDGKHEKLSHEREVERVRPKMRDLS